MDAKQWWDETAAEFGLSPDEVEYWRTQDLEFEAALEAKRTCLGLSKKEFEEKWELVLALSVFDKRKVALVKDWLYGPE